MYDGLSSKRSRAQNESVDFTRKRILTAAVRIFSRDGFQGATTREIAREAGVNEVTIFRHFRTREELLHSTLKHTCSSLDTLIQPDEDWSDDLFGRLALRELCTRAIRSDAGQRSDCPSIYQRSSSFARNDSALTSGIHVKTKSDVYCAPATSAGGGWCERN